MTTHQQDAALQQETAAPAKAPVAGGALKENETGTSMAKKQEEPNASLVVVVSHGDTKEARAKKGGAAKNKNEKEEPAGGVVLSSSSSPAAAAEAAETYDFGDLYTAFQDIQQKSQYLPETSGPRSRPDLDRHDRATIGIGVMPLPGAFVMDIVPGAIAIAGPGVSTASVEHNENGSGVAPTDDLEQGQDRSPSSLTDEDRNGLAVACRVEQEEFQEAEQVHTEEVRAPKKQMHRGAALGLLLCFVAVLSAIVVAIVLSTRNHNENNSASGTEAPAAALATTTAELPLEERIWNLFPDKTRVQIEKQGTPQQSAFAWLMEDPAWHDRNALTRLPGVQQPPTDLSDTDEDHDDVYDPYPEWRIRQRFALATLYYATAGNLWSNSTHWLSYKHHECFWWHTDYVFASTIFEDPGLLFDGEGVCNFGSNSTTTTDNTTTDSGTPDTTTTTTTTTTLEIAKDSKVGKYKHIWLPFNNLDGVIPPEFFWLDSLESIDFFGNNKIQGSSLLEPTNLVQLSNLEFFNPAINQITGEIPSEIGLLSNLIFVILVKNNVMGTIPSEIGRLTKLRIWISSSNKLTGPLPTEIGNLQEAYFFTVNDNFLTGPIPTEIAHMDALETLGLSNNPFISGSIPSELGNLKKALNFGFDRMQLTGSIPSELGRLNLESMLLDHNHLSGAIPSELYAGFNYSEPSWVDVYASPFKVMLNLTENPLLTGTIPDNLCLVEGSENNRVVAFECSSTLCGCACPCT